MRPPHRRPHRFSAHPQIDTRATSPTILGVVAVLPEPSVKMRALCIRHAHTGCLHPRAHPADASAAWRPSPHMAVEPRPDAGALTGAAAGPAGRAVETPICHHRGSLIPRVRNRRWQSRRAALQGHSGNRNPLRSAAPSQTTPPHGAMQRGRRRRENLEDHPAIAIRYVRRKAPFKRANCPASWFGRR